MKPTAAETLRLRPATYSPRMPPADRERNAGQRDQAVAHRIEQAVEQRQDQEQAERHDDREPLLGLLQRAELARPLHAVALRQRHVLGDALLRLGDGRAEVALAHAVFQRDEALAVLPVDVGGAGLQPHVGDVAERDIGGVRLRIAVRQRDRDRADGVDVVAVSRRQPHGERGVDLALIDARHLLAADRRLHHRVDVADREAVARRLGAVDPHHEIGLAEEVERRRIDDTRHLGELGLERFRQPLQLAEIAAEQLDRILAFDARHRLFDVVLDVLREVEIDADELAN